MNIDEYAALTTFRVSGRAFSRRFGPYHLLRDQSGGEKAWCGQKLGKRSRIVPAAYINCKACLSTIIVAVGHAVDIPETGKEYERFLIASDMLQEIGMDDLAIAARVVAARKL